MSDSLKDQLLKAGFTETERASSKQRSGKNQSGKKNASRKHPKAKSSPNSNKPRSGDKYKPAGQPAHRSGHHAAGKGRQSEVEKPEVIAEKKRVKAAIKELIENNATKDVTGEIAYSYMLGARVKQLFVKKEILEKLASDELVITRLNGSTHIIKPELVEQILALNPEWAIIRNDAKTVSKDESEPGYEDYQIPDDLMW